MHDPVTLEEFLRGADGESRHDKIWAILDVKQAAPSHPAFIYHLNDGLTSHIHNVGLDPHRQSVPIDCLTSAAWLLLHHGGFHTYTHIDASGQGTYSQTLTGYKAWIIMRDPALKNAKSRQDYKNAHVMLREYEDDEVERYVVWLYPGDIL